MNADPIARFYRWLEYIVFGAALERRRLEFLGSLTDARNALFAGEGDGRFLAAFLRNNQQCTVRYIDSSKEMIRLAQMRCRSERVTFELSDIRSCECPSLPYDLIVTHFFLDCFDSPQCNSVVRRISSASAAKARWVISEFRVPHTGLARWWALLWIRICYVCFRFTTGLRTGALPDYSQALSANGFQLLGRRISRSGMLVSEMWQRS
jgi:ubiquinone/menaquinone biosynthesis C-methylase UbiE